MRDFFKIFFTIVLFSSAFLIGFNMGKEKERERIPNFQEDIDLNQ